MKHMFLAPLLTAACQSTVSGALTLIAAHSGSHLKAINGNFWIGKPPLTYCPARSVAPGHCPPGTETALRVLNGGCGLATSVPGGQNVYIASSGALSFTGPHTEGPAMVSMTGFVYQNDTNVAGTLGKFSFIDLGSLRGFIACPTAKGTGPYQIFADLPDLSDVPGGDVRTCIALDVLGNKYTSETAAWEYNLL